MRFMMIVKATKESEAGMMPSERLLATMAKFNQELVKAGVLLDASGLQQSAKGFRVKFSSGKRTIVDGPFAESKELVAGYWIIKVKSREEALEWAKKVPSPVEDGDGEIEVRQFFELEDFAPSPAIEQHRENARKLAAKK
jgi:hypothetical protein